MGKIYYGGIGTDKGFVMHSPGSKYHYSRDDEFHKEDDKRDVGSTSNTGGGNSSNELFLKCSKPVYRYRGC